MAYKRKGQLICYAERHKHLRRFGKRFFWKRERLAEKNVIEKNKDE